MQPPDSRPPELTWFGPWRAWNRFFFAPADPRPLALVRILTGLLLSWNLVWIGTDLQAFLGSTGWADKFDGTHGSIAPTGPPCGGRS